MLLRNCTAEIVKGVEVVQIVEDVEDVNAEVGVYGGKCH